MDNTIKRLGLWALGTLLPKPHILDRHIHHLAWGMAYLVFGGVIVVAIFLGLLAGTYAVLLAQGLSVIAAAAITLTLALLGAAICFLLADRALGRVIQVTNDLKVSSPSLPKIEATLDLQEGVSVLVQAFLAGFRGPRREKHRYDEQADLFEDEEEETIAELHLRTEAHPELSKEDDKDIIHFRPRSRR